MATRIETVEREGKLVYIYDNGMERDAASGQIIKPPAGKPFTPETAKLARRKRQEKTARLMRQRIRETHNAIMPHPVQTSAEAFAESAAMIYEQVVVNSEAYPRDRLEAWEKIGKYAGLLPADAKERAEDITIAIQNNLTAGGNGEHARILARVWRDVMKVQQEERIVEGKLVDP
jgi:hypothetical protein